MAGILMQIKQIMKKMLRAGVRNQWGGFEGLQGEVEA